MQTRTQSAASLSLLLALGMFVWVILVYTFLHEVGHALAAWLAGGQVYTFNINFFNLGAQVSASHSAQIFSSLAGMALPVLVWFGFILNAPRRGSPALEALKIVASAGVIGSMLAWVIIPLVYASGGAPVNDDVTRFLSLSGINPHLAAGVFGGLTAGMYALARRKIQEGNALREMLLGEAGWLGWQQNRNLYTRMLAVAAGVLFVTVLINLAGGGSRGGVQSAPPEGYQLVRRIDLAGQTNRDEVIAAFTRGGGQGGGVFLQLNQVESEYINVQLVGADGSSRSLFHAEGYTAALDRVEFTQELPPGEYKLVLNAARSRGTLAVYLRGR